MLGNVSGGRALFGVAIGAAVGMVLGAGLALNGANQQLAADVDTLQRQNAALEHVTRAHAACEEKFSAATVVYGPAEYDITDKVPRSLSLGLNAIAAQSHLGGHVRLLVTFADMPMRPVLAVPAKVQPIAPPGNPYSFAWFTKAGRIAGPAPVLAGAVPEQP
jgi:hypothetical protein